MSVFPQGDAQGSQGVRQELVDQAVEFLTDPRVVSHPDDKKRRYLKNKGMTDEEINTAFSKAQTTPVSSQASPYHVAQTPHVNTMSITRSQIQSILNRIPSLGSLAFVLLICYGLSAAVVRLIKYAVMFWWPSKNEYEEKVVGIENKVENVAEKVEAQVEDIKEVTQALKDYLESQVESSNETVRYDLFSQRQQKTEESDLKKNVASIKFLLPTVGSINRMKNMSHGSDLLEEIGEVKNEIANVKGSIKNSLQGSTIPTIRKSLKMSTDGSLENTRTYEQPEWLKNSKPQIPSWQQSDELVREEASEEVDTLTSETIESPEIPEIPETQPNT